jgi:hypothetical protein
LAAASPFSTIGFYIIAFADVSSNLLRTVVIFQVRSKMQHLAMKSLKIQNHFWTRDDSVHKIKNKEFDAFVKKAFIRCDEFQLFLHRAVPKKNATVWNQGFGMSPNNCVDHVWEKCLPFHYTKLYMFLCERTWQTTVLRKLWSQVCALLTVFSMHHCETYK